MKDITENYNLICLYCGENYKSRWEDREQYAYCDCKDQKEKDNILEQIEDLEISIPKYKFERIKKEYLKKKGIN